MRTKRYAQLHLDTGALTFRDATLAQTRQQQGVASVFELARRVITSATITAKPAQFPVRPKRPQDAEVVTFW
jgi:hypothetical protein